MHKGDTMRVIDNQLCITIPRPGLEILYDTGKTAIIIYNNWGKDMPECFTSFYRNVLYNLKADLLN